MVLWEIALGTAYFLGLKRSNRLALRIQRRLISPKYPKIREFAQRRTRNVIDAALRVHLKVEEIGTGIRKTFDNGILGWFGKRNPAAYIEGPPPGGNVNLTSIRKHISAEANQRRLQNLRGKSEHLFAAARNISLGKRHTRYVSDAALRVQLKAQEMRSGIRQTVDNRILGWLGRPKPTASIVGPPAAAGGGGYVNLNSIKQQIKTAANPQRLQDLRGKGEHLFSAARNILPTTINMMRPLRPAGGNIQHRQYGTGGSEFFTARNGKFGFGEVFRNDIRQYLQHH